MHSQRSHHHRQHSHQVFHPGATFQVRPLHHNVQMLLFDKASFVIRDPPASPTLHKRFDLPFSAAMLKLAEMEYNGANSIFLRLLLDKKYALPFRVLDALVAHFLSFRNEKRVLPVLWHQSLLTLAQRYKADLASEQKTALQELLKLQTHPHISAEIRRELQNSESRDIEIGLPVTVEMD